MRKLRELAREAFKFVHTHRKVFIVALVAIVVVSPIGFVLADNHESASQNAGELFSEFTTNPTETLLLTGAGVLNAIASLLGQFILVLINMLVVPILGYNNFSNSNVISLGWSLTRDLVNMFAVVMLLVLAIMTLAGYHKANWAQQLPKFFIAMVLVNFSRTIVGVFVDISQVIMFTFVNAIIDVAAGNFAQLFNLTDFGTFDADYIAKQNESGTGLDAAALFAGALFQVPLYLSIAAVMFLLAAAFIWRIVTLWMVFIMAPIAFFMFFAKELFGKAADIWKEFWSKLVAACVLGCVLSAFVWLGLAAAGGSNLAKAENLPMPSDPAVSGIPLKQASLDRLTGTFLALAFMILGLAQSATFASSLGGLAGKALGGDGMARGIGIVKGAMRPFKTGKGWATAGGKAALEFSSKAAPGLTNLAGRGAVRAGTALAGVTGAGWAGQALAKVGNKTYATSQKELDAKKKEMLEGLKNTAPSYRENLYKSMAQEGGPGNLFNSLSATERTAFAGTLLSSTKEQKKAKEAIEKQFDMTTDDGKKKAAAAYENLIKGQISAYDGAKDKDAYGLDDAGKSALGALKTQNLHLLDPGRKDGESDADYANRKQAHIQKFIQDQRKDGKFDPRLLSKEAATDANVMAVLEKESMRTDKDNKPISILDDMKNGQYGSNLKEAFQPNIKAMNRDSFVVPAAGATGEAEGVKAIADRINQLAKSDSIGKLDGTAFDELKKAMNDDRVRQNLSVTVSAQVDNQMLKAEEKVLGAPAAAAAVFGTLPSGGAPLSVNVQGRIEQVLHQDPLSVRLLAPELPSSSDPHNQVSQVAYDSITKESMKEMQKQIMNSTGDQLKQATDAFKQVESLIQNERNQIRANASMGMDTKQQEKKVRALEQMRDQTQRYVR